MHGRLELETSANIYQCEAKLIRTTAVYVLFGHNPLVAVSFLREYMGLDYVLHFRACLVLSKSKEIERD